MKTKIMRTAMVDDLLKTRDSLIPAERSKVKIPQQVTPLMSPDRKPLENLRMDKRTHKEFKIAGYTIIALNFKNALRKARKEYGVTVSPTATPSVSPSIDKEDWEKIMEQGTTEEKAEVEWMGKLFHNAQRKMG